MTFTPNNSECKRCKEHDDFSIAEYICRLGNQEYYCCDTCAGWFQMMFQGVIVMPILEKEKNATQH